MKLSSFSAVAICSLLLAACGGNKTAKTPGEALFDPMDYTLTVTDIENADSAYLYLYDYDALVEGPDGAVIDSVMILNGQAKLDIKGSTAPVAMIQASKKGMRFVVFPQPGENTFNYAAHQGSGELYGKFTAHNDSINHVMASATENMPEEATMAYQAYIDSVDNLIATIKSDALKSNIDNAFGFYLASNAAQQNPEMIDSIVVLAPHFADTKRIRKAIENYEHLKATSVGQPYTDFTIESPANGKTVKLSDYVKPGQYTLVDFWASWCGPCKRAINALKKDYPALKEKGLNVVGVTVWEDPEKTQAWLQEKPENAIPWELILDAQRIPTDLYAVNGIPTMILIGPDGTILARSHSDEEVVAAFNEAIAPAPAE